MKGVVFMDYNELAQEIISIGKQFKVTEINFNNAYKEYIISRLDDFKYVETLIDIFEKYRFKIFINRADKKRLKNLLIELNKIKVMLFIDETLLEKAK